MQLRCWLYFPHFQCSMLFEVHIKKMYANSFWVLVMNLEFLGLWLSWYKLPRNKLSDNCTLTNRLIIVYSEPANGLIIVYSELTNCLIIVYSELASCFSCWDSFSDETIFPFYDLCFPCDSDVNWIEDHTLVTIMDTILDRVAKDYGRRNSSSPSTSGDIFEPSSSSNGEAEGANHLIPCICWTHSCFGWYFSWTILCYVYS